MALARGAHYVETAHAKNSWAKVRWVSVDETSARRGHRYVTNVLDAQTHDLLLMVEGRSAQALEAFAQALVAHGGKAEQIELINMDMSPAYQSGASQFFPQAQIVFISRKWLVKPPIRSVRNWPGQEPILKGSLWRCVAMHGPAARSNASKEARCAIAIPNSVGPSACAT
jgi:Transposase